MSPHVSQKSAVATIISHCSFRRDNESIVSSLSMNVVDAPHKNPGVIKLNESTSLTKIKGFVKF